MKELNADTGMTKCFSCCCQQFSQLSKPSFRFIVRFHWPKTKAQSSYFSVTPHNKMLPISPLLRFEICRTGTHARVAQYGFAGHLLSFSNARSM